MQNVRYGIVLQDENQQIITDKVIISSFKEICKSVYNADGEWDIDE